VSHAKLVRRAVAWLRGGVEENVGLSGVAEFVHKRKCRPVYAEIYGLTGEQPDAIGWCFGVSHVVECKVSRGDFFSDRSKPHMRDETSGMGRHRWYLTPPGLVTADETPAWCGLAYAQPRRRIEIVKLAPRRAIDETASLEECRLLAGAIRRHVLGVPWFGQHARFETLDERDERKLREKT
jgi:hypothetical protein